MADNLVDCAYCDALVNPKDVPTVDDDETWQRIASAHSVDCEWVLTRAHRVNLERVESDNYSIPEWRLLAMLALKPGLTREIAIDVLLADWPEGDEHQTYLDAGDLHDLADWAMTTGRDVLRQHREDMEADASA